MIHKCIEKFETLKIDDCSGEGINTCEGIFPMTLSIWHAGKDGTECYFDDYVEITVKYCPFCGLKSQPNKDKMYPPGTEIEIEIDGKKYLTIIDKHDVQRFKKNSLLSYLVDIGEIDLNKLSIAYQEGMFSKEEYAEFNMDTGYSVCGWADIEAFQDMEIKNPVWEHE